MSYRKFFVLFVLCIGLFFFEEGNAQKTQGIPEAVSLNTSNPFIVSNVTKIQWRTWGKVAFQEAIEKDKLIFVSIHYSGCPWCEMMRRESLQDESAVKLLNSRFVPIFINALERPEVNHFALNVSLFINNQTGWPINAFLTPKREVVFITNFLQKNDKGNKKGFPTILKEIDSLWYQNPDAVKNLASVNMHLFKKVMKRKPYLGKTNKIQVFLQKQTHTFLRANQEMIEQYLRFPAGHIYSYYLYLWKWTGDANLLHIVESTLTRLRTGVLFDQIGYGFHRFEGEQSNPHLEKMLYSQALMNLVFLEVYQITGKKFYLDSAVEILEFVLHELQGKEGFYASQGGTIEEMERYYLWTIQELKQIISANEWKQFTQRLSLNKYGLFLMNTSDESKQETTTISRDALEALRKKNKGS